MASVEERLRENLQAQIKQLRGEVKSLQDSHYERMRERDAALARVAVLTQQCAIYLAEAVMWEDAHKKVCVQRDAALARVAQLENADAEGTPEAIRLLDEIGREREALLAVLEAAERIVTRGHITARDDFGSWVGTTLEFAIAAARELVPRTGP